MGQKTNPIGLRLGIIKPWESRWFSERDYSKLLQEDIDLRKFLFKKLSSAGISKIVIERPAKLANVTLYTSRPGVIIGKKGSDIEKLKKSVSKIVSGDVNINIVEIKKPELDSQLVADNIAVHALITQQHLHYRGVPFMSGNHECCAIMWCEIRL